MALRRREVAAFVLVAAAVAVGLVFAVRGCSEKAGSMTQTLAPQTATATTVALDSREGVVRAHLQTSDPRLAAGEVVLSQQITDAFAVVALRSDRRSAAFALRREGGRWVVDEGGPVRLRALRPDPGERVVRRTQLAAEILADREIVEGGLWLDGVAVPGNSGGTSPRRITMYTEAPQPLARGVHVVIAFASTAADAAALAWTFEVVAD